MSKRLQVIISVMIFAIAGSYFFPHTTPQNIPPEISPQQAGAEWLVQQARDHGDKVTAITSTGVAISPDGKAFVTYIVSVNHGPLRTVKIDLERSVYRVYNASIVKAGAA